MITLVPFYRDVIDPSPSLKKHLNARQNFDYRLTVSRMSDTFLKFSGKNAKVVVQTDMTTPFENYDVFRSDISAHSLMQSIVQSNTNYIKNCDLGKHVLVGADHLFMGDGNIFFEDDYDIGLYVRSHANEPITRQINNTAVCVNMKSNNKNEIINFFIDRENEYDKNTQYHDWYGDQHSIFATLQRYNIINEYWSHKKSKQFFDYQGIKIKLMEYNKEYLMMLNRNGEMEFDKSKAVMLDFKGEDFLQKKYINEIYNNIMNGTL
mgnify:CR=1 FL=1